MLPLTIMSFNVAGIADPDKRALLFRFLRDHPAHVICLQEVHAPDDSSFWSVHWGGPASWNWHTAILLSPSLGSPQFDVSHEGRVLSSTFRYQGQVYKIANIYAHADRSDRAHFFDRLSDSADLYSSYDFLVGDWNAYPDPVRDRSSTASVQLFQTWPHLLPVLAPFTDAAFAGADAPYYTFHKINRHHIPMHSRLDHVFMNVRHTSFTPTTLLHHFSRSDHDAVHVTFTPLPILLPFFGATTLPFFPLLIFVIPPSVVFSLSVHLLSGTLPRTFLNLLHRTTLLSPPAAVSLTAAASNASCPRPTVAPPATSRTCRPPLPSLIFAAS